MFSCLQLMNIAVWNSLTFASTYLAEFVTRTLYADTVSHEGTGMERTGHILVDAASGASSLDVQPSPGSQTYVA